MKKTKGTGVMLFGMFAIIVIIAVFILAGNGLCYGLPGYGKGVLRPV